MIDENTLISKTAQLVTSNEKSSTRKRENQEKRNKTFWRLIYLVCMWMINMGNEDTFNFTKLNWSNRALHYLKYAPRVYFPLWVVGINESQLLCSFFSLLICLLFPSCRKSADSRIFRSSSIRVKSKRKFIIIIAMLFMISPTRTSKRSGKKMNNVMNERKHWISDVKRKWNSLWNIKNKNNSTLMSTQLAVTDMAASKHRFC